MVVNWEPVLVLSLLFNTFTLVDLGLAIINECAMHFRKWGQGLSNWTVTVDPWFDLPIGDQPGVALWRLHAGFKAAVSYLQSHSQEKSRQENDHA